LISKSIIYLLTTPSIRYQPDSIDYRKQEYGDLYLIDGVVKRYIIDLDINIYQLKGEVISNIKQEAWELLSKTDWYVVRKSETGEDIPSDIITERNDIRSKTEQFETDIQQLDSIDDVLNYTWTF
jgi:hypothetical protein